MATANRIPNSSKRLPPRDSGRPTNEGLAALHDHIVIVAGELFSEVGFGKATMDAIAVRAKISKRTLYTRFSNKSELFQAFVIGELEAWKQREAVDAGPPAITLADTVRSAVHNHIRALLSPEISNALRLIHAEGRIFPDLGTEFYEANYHSGVLSLAEQIRYYADLDKFPCKDPVSAAEALRGLVTGAVQTKQLSGQLFDVDVMADRLSELFLASRSAW
jgi:TetR/AcrR family transcriptional regulator, mexJK operon transcriptional repressor